MTSIDLICFAGAPNLPIFAAIEHGNFADHGVDINMTTTPSSAYQAEHLINGTFQMAGTAFDNVVAGFRVWWVSALYIAANAFLGLHLYHGLWSMFRSLGWNRPGCDKPTRRFAQVFSWVVTLGNLSFPLAVLAGVVR